MLFLELAAQSVRGFSPSVRITLKPGYSALLSPAETPAPFGGLVLALAFPDGRGGDGAFLAPGASTGRAGLSIQGHDGTVWRVMRDLGGAGGLHKLNRTSGKFDLVTQDAGDMVQTLRSSAGLPPRTTWEQLFTLSAAQLPTKRPKSAAGAAKAPARVVSKWDNFDAGSGGGGPEIDPAKLPELEKELAQAKRAAEVQFRADGISGELFELESKVKAVDEVSQQVAEARAQAARFDRPELSDEFIARVRRLPDEHKRHQEQLARIQDELRALEETAPTAPPPLHGDQRFLASLVAGLGLFIAAIFMEGALRYLSLLSLVPFTFAALLALRYIEDLQRLSRGGGKAEVLTSREKKLQDDHAMNQAGMTKVFELVGVNTAEDFLAAIESRDAMRARVAELEQRESNARQALESTGIKGRYDALKAEQETLNQELLGMSGGYLRDVRDIERDLARAREGAAPKSAPSAISAPPPEGEQWEDPGPALLSLAGDLFSNDVPTLWALLKDRATQYLGALTNKRYVGFAATKEGRLSLETAAGPQPVGGLPGKDLDLAWLALRLTIVEKAAPTHKLPLVIEDTFSTLLEPPQLPLFGRMVKHLGTLTQVIHIAGAGQTASQGDVPVSI